MAFTLQTGFDNFNTTTNTTQPTGIANLDLGLLLINISMTAPNATLPREFNLVCATANEAASPARRTCINVVNGSVLISTLGENITLAGPLPLPSGRSLIVNLGQYPRLASGLANRLFPAVNTTEVTFNVGGNANGCLINAVLLSAATNAAFTNDSSLDSAPKVRARAKAQLLGFSATASAARPEAGTETVQSGLDVEECRLLCWQSRSCQGFNFQIPQPKDNDTLVAVPSRCALFDYGPRTRYADAPLANLPTYYDTLSTYFARVDALHEYRIFPNAAAWPAFQLHSRTCSSAAQASVACLYFVAGCRSFDFVPASGVCTFYSYRALTLRRLSRSPGVVHHDVEPLDLRVLSRYRAQAGPRSTKVLRLASVDCSPLKLTVSDDDTCAPARTLEAAATDDSVFGELVGGVSAAWSFPDTFWRYKAKQPAPAAGASARFTALSASAEYSFVEVSCIFHFWFVLLVGLTVRLCPSLGNLYQNTLGNRSASSLFPAVFASYVLGDRLTSLAIDVSYLTVQLDLPVRENRTVLVGLALLGNSACSASATVWDYSSSQDGPVKLLTFALTTAATWTTYLPLDPTRTHGGSLRVDFSFGRCSSLAEIVPFFAPSATSLMSPLVASRNATVPEGRPRVWNESEFYFVSASSVEIRNLPASRTVYASTFIGEYAVHSAVPTRCIKSDGSLAIVALATQWNALGFSCAPVAIDSPDLANYLHWLEAMDVQSPATMWPVLQPLRALIAARLRGNPDYEWANMAAFNAMPNYLQFSDAREGLSSSLKYDGIVAGTGNTITSLDMAVDAQRKALDGRDSYALLQRVQYRFYRANARLGQLLLPYHCQEGWAMQDRRCVPSMEDSLITTYLQYASTPSASSLERVLDYIGGYLDPRSPLPDSKKWRAAAVLGVAVNTATGNPSLSGLLARASDLLNGLGELLRLRPNRVRNVPNISVATFAAVLERSALIFKEVTDQARYVELQQALSDVSKEFNENLVTMQGNILQQVIESANATNDFIRQNVEALSKNLVENLAKVETTIQKSTKETAVVALRAQAENAKIMAASLLKEINVRFKFGWKESSGGADLGLEMLRLRCEPEDANEVF
jgi:hypothetical protein